MWTAAQGCPIGSGTENKKHVIEYYIRSMISLGCTTIQQYNKTNKTYKRQPHTKAAFCYATRRMRRKRITEYELGCWIQKLIEQDNMHAFYTSSHWVNLSREVFKKQNNECQRCKAKGIHTKARVAHHKRYVRDYPRLALTRDNIECLCSQCHEEEHERNKKAEKFLNEERW